MDIKKFRNFDTDSILIIVDVQRSFKQYFTDNYLLELKKYCAQFQQVYQIFDNHVDGKEVSKDYLYQRDSDIEHHQDLYTFPNQTQLIEKRYNYDVDADFYKKILDLDVYKTIKEKEKEDSLKRGDFFKTTAGTIIVYIGNNHRWHHMSKKLYGLFSTLKRRRVTLVGGSSGECLLDIEVCGLSMGVDIQKNKGFIYSATKCPIK